MSTNIVKRRIQKLGGSSLIVTLPKSWAKKLGLDVGDTIIIVDEGNYLKIFSLDPSMIHGAETIRLRIPQHLISLGLNYLIECLYVKGYKRFTAQLPQSKPLENVLRLVEEVRSHPKVRSANLEYNEIIVSFDEVETDSILRPLRQYNTKIQELMEFIEQIKTRHVNPEVIERYVNEAVDLAKVIGRTLRKHELTMCKADTIDPSVVAPLTMIPQVLGMIYGELVKLDDIQEDIIKKLKMILLEAFGGLLNKSSKRITTAIKLAEEIRMEAENLSNKNPGVARLAGIISVLTIIVRNIGESTICESMVGE